MWPKEDHNRALVGYTFSGLDQSVFRAREYHWINVVPMDIRLHLVASTFGGNSKFLSLQTFFKANLRVAIVRNKVTREQLALPGITECIPQKRMKTGTSELELIKYCKYLHRATFTYG